MKKILSLVLVTACLISGSAFKMNSFSSSSNVPLKITYYAANTIEGYSYNSKMKVSVDGNEVGVSPVKDQKEKNTFVVMVPKGDHQLKCVIWAEIKPGQWEERLKANDYSFDWTYESAMKFKKKNKMTIEFNIKEERSIRK